MIKKLIAKLFGNQVRNIVVSEAEEHRILYEMYQIEGIKNYWELQAQGGYQLFSKSRDEKYLGYTAMAENILNIFAEMNKPEDKEEHDGDGYDSSV